MAKTSIKKNNNYKLNRNNDVSYSRAGDAFHYRWAARRCLKLLDPRSSLVQITIEGSKEPDKKGECVIDIAEYYVNNENLERIEYYQLKHTTKRKAQPFTISELKNTIKGFANRFSEHFINKKNHFDNPLITFLIVTNRSIKQEIKNTVKQIASGSQKGLFSGVYLRLYNTLKSYTNLSKENLRKFCSMLEFTDNEGNFSDQYYELKKELSKVLAGNVDTPLMNNIITLVSEKVLPDSNRIIVREELLLRCFGVTSENLFPAPAVLEGLSEIIKRKQFDELVTFILEPSQCKIVHAAGGVGKSIATQYIAKSLPKDSVAIIYDCFGGGTYRNRSKLRHRYCDALIQIANELSLQGLCDPLIPSSNSKEDEILKKFLHHISVAINSLWKRNKDAILILLIDAADNAEMAAQEFGDTSFAHEILKENFPEGCKIVLMCRTERRYLLKPISSIPQFELLPFNEHESFEHLKKFFPESSEFDGLEFHRFTNGNPRVQANSLNAGYKSISEVLDSLGPNATTVDDQIEIQLNLSLEKVKDSVAYEFNKSVENICIGLSVLPPLVPIKVLATAAQVDQSNITSFVSDLGKALWISESNIQFRDEPTETWFKNNFAAKTEQIVNYIDCLKPLAKDYTYVSETIPSLLLRANKFDELIELALSDELLPKSNPIDERNVRVFRLKFAFKAALKLKKYKEAIKLALRAGEEVAGDKRQNEFLAKNIDLIEPLQSEQKVQELAFKKLLGKSWVGSENIYSSSLLSTVRDYHGEARGFLRAAENWLSIYFEERKKDKEYRHQDELSDEDIAELVFAHFNLFGAKAAVKYILRWSPAEIVLKIGKMVIKRLVDAGNFEAVNEILKTKFNNSYLIIAIAEELLEVGRFPTVSKLEYCLNEINENKIAKPLDYFKDTSDTSIISFLEACFAKHLPKSKILEAIDFYFEKEAKNHIKDEYYRKDRDVFLRCTALRCLLNGNLEPDVEEFLPKELNKKSKYDQEYERQELKEIIESLLPWYLLRARLLVDMTDNIEQEFHKVQKESKNIQSYRWRERDLIPIEVSWIKIEILKFCSIKNDFHIQEIFDEWKNHNAQMRINDRLRALRVLYRLSVPDSILSDMEQSTYELVSSLKSEGPETRAEWYIKIARAVLPHCKMDAAFYFNKAIEIMSKFGDEIVQRWDAVVTLAKRSTDEGNSSTEMAYRFIRCAELIGENVAREKYWDRSEAIKTCVKLSPTSALAAISRWRDRDVGWFYDQTYDLIEELITTKVILPKIGWSLSSFIQHKVIVEFAAVCIENESSNDIRQIIFDMVIQDLRLSDTDEKPWEILKYLAEKYGLINKDLEEILSFYLEDSKKKKEKEKNNSSVPHSVKFEEKEVIDWDYIFNGLELAKSTQINKALKRFYSLPLGFHPKYEFWHNVILRINDNDVVFFLKELIYVDDIDTYEVREVLSTIPNRWREKVSVRQNWQEILELIGQKFAYEFTNKYSLKYFLKEIKESHDAAQSIYNGVISGLERNLDSVDANVFFGVVDLIIKNIQPHEANELLDYALSRFEQHIEEDFGDGTWGNWLNPPKEISEAVAGFIWSALGSPRSEIRWRAAHCIRRLSEMNGDNIINSLMKWMEKDTCDAFGYNKYPFYSLHARLYLFIALARISIDNTQLLRNHSDIFVKHALNSISHILIQIYSARIALKIEIDNPNTYKKTIVKQLNQVGKSIFPIKEISWEDKRNIVKDNNTETFNYELKYYHSYDFDRYWFEPLGRVFNIPAKEVEKSATIVIQKDWQIKNEGGYKNDPRSNIWRSRRYDRETSHSHGSYPDTDDYSFYLSYHSMLIIAGRLINELPIVRITDWYDDQWDRWLSNHMLTRNDGKWLADRRDAIPLEKRDWIYNKDTENWVENITDEDFLNLLSTGNKNNRWVNVEGNWNFGEYFRNEECTISTAFIPVESAQALLNAVSTYTNPYDIGLPYYKDKDMEMGLEPFCLTGWLLNNYVENGLDKFDPYAGEILYPPYRIGEEIIKIMKLSTDSEFRNWFQNNDTRPSLKCEIWSSEKEGYEGERLKNGIRLKASLDFLMKLCQKLNKELIIKILIERRIRHNHNSENVSSLAYKPPRFKIFILSPNGVLRDERKNIELR